LNADKKPVRRFKQKSPTPSKAPRKVVKKKVGLFWGDSETEKDTERSLLREKLNTWREEGYNVSRLEEIIDNDLEEVKEAFKEFEEDCFTLSELALELELLSLSGFNEEIDVLKPKLKDPDQIGAIRAGIDELKEKIEEKEGDEEGEGKSICIICGYPLFAETKCPRCGAQTTIAAMEETLKTSYTFEDFLVDQANSFAIASAKAVAENPGKEYNPLLIQGATGLGKSHLLRAIADHINKKDPKSKVAYVGAEQFINEFIIARQTGKIDDFRVDYINVSTFLMDDIHLLAGKERTQEEFLHILEELHNNKRQIVITSNRPPSEIPELSDKFISLFRGGLVVEIKVPSYETRMNILRNKAKLDGLSAPEDVLGFIANKVPNNIQDMKDSLKKVLGYSSLMQVEPTVEMASEMLRISEPKEKEEIKEAPKEKEKVQVEEEVKEEEVPEKKKPKSKKKMDLKGGYCYLVEEEIPKYSLEIFTGLEDEKYTGLCITRMNPRRLRNLADLKDTKIMWLTDKDSNVESTIQPSLELIIYTIGDLIKTSEKGVLLLDGIEYLVSNNGFDAVLRFIRRLVDDFSESQSILLLVISPFTLKQQELKTIEREMEVIKPNETDDED
jgi:chromosomal replication initiator protein DnaA